jgi:hypothetical protein
MDELEKREVVGKILSFFARIGLPAERGEVGPDSFLPGLTIRSGVLVVDEALLAYPGDLLHEAGHLATMEPAARRSCSGDVGDDAGFEMGAIAWSYAAAIELGLPLETVFHAAGYKSGGASIVDNFSKGHYFGVPILQWLGMTTERTGRTPPDAVGPFYPVMQKWLRGGEQSLG